MQIVVAQRYIVTHCIIVTSKKGATRIVHTGVRVTAHAAQLHCLNTRTPNPHITEFKSHPSQGATSILYITRLHHPRWLLDSISAAGGGHFSLLWSSTAGYSVTGAAAGLVTFQATIFSIIQQNRNSRRIWKSFHTVYIFFLSCGAVHFV